MYSGFANENELIRHASLNRLDRFSKLAFELDIKWVFQYFVVWSIPGELAQHEIQRSSIPSPKKTNNVGLELPFQKLSGGKLSQ